MKKITLITAVVSLIVVLPAVTQASYPFKSFRFGITPGAGYSILHEDVYTAIRLNFRIQEQFTVFVAAAYLGGETIETTHSYPSYPWGETHSWTEEEDQGVPELATGLRISLIRFEEPIKRTFFQFDPKKVKFIHLRFVRSLKPYAEIVAGTSAGGGIGVEWQPVGIFSLDLGVNLGYSFIAEEEGFYVAPRLLIGVYPF